jgi:endonuclease-8
MVTGIGNIYKSKAMFLARIDPRCALGCLSRPAVERLWRTVIPLMRQGVNQGRMRTRLRSREGLDDRFWVYQRRGKPCVRGGSTIERIKQGNPPRSSYLCPQCQGPQACSDSQPSKGSPAKQRHLALG